MKERGGGKETNNCYILIPKRDGAKNSFKLKDSAYGRTQQYPKEIVDRRKKRVPVMH